MKQYKKNKSAILCGKPYFYSVKTPSTIIVKTIDDLKLADFVIKSKSKKFELKYDKIKKN